MVSRVSFDVDDVLGDPPVKFLAGDNHLLHSTCVVHLPLGVVAQMCCVSHGLVFELLDFHLFDCVSPRIEIDLATLRVEREIGHFDQATCVYSNFRHPCYHARMRNPRVEVFHFVQVLISSHSKFFFSKLVRN